MGVHSLDQIVYGCSLGVWAVFFMHFYVRDNLIMFVEKINIWQDRGREAGFVIAGSPKNAGNKGQQEMQNKALDTS